MNKTAYREMVLASWREIVRTPVNLFLSVLFPLCFVFMFAFLPDVRVADRSVPISGLAFGLPAVLIFATLSLGVLGTAAPLTVYRQRGVLRILGCTPVSRLGFIAAQVPVRLGVVVAEFALIFLTGAVAGEVRLSGLPAALLTLLVVAGCMLSLGFLVGGLLRSPELLGAIGGILMPVVLFASGVMLPMGMMPSAVRLLARGLPFTYMGDLLRHQLLGVPAEHPLWLSYAAIVGATVLLAGLTVHTFRWDEEK
ncbi:hypothetical protein ACZ90_67180 [Streptomyces albus subsp. albus]|nr:hypothetical protein ACZ90_67180 [Streptomyces albus subsp. albus]